MHGPFNEVAEALKPRNIYPMSEEPEDAALEYLQRFDRREGDHLYSGARSNCFRKICSQLPWTRHGTSNAPTVE